MKKIEKSNVLELINNKPLYLYGAGSTAKVCIEALRAEGVEIAALIDDDAMKHGMKVLSYTVLSYGEFSQICADKDSVNVVLTSIYGKQIYNKLMLMPSVTVWEMYEWYADIVNQQDAVTERSCEGESLEAYRNNTDGLKQYLEDDESRNVYDAVYYFFKTKNTNKLVDVCTAEESYFIKEVVEYFKNKCITVVDAGAYTGDLLRTIVSSGVNVGKWYCFEVEKNNYEQLRNNVGKSSLPEGMKCICENCGLWSEREDLPIINLGTASNVAESAGADDCEICRMETIDEYFKDIRVDMIKMDIEGAEMEALKGAVKTIRRDNPLLAISIYHYVEDYYRIMQFLMKSTEGGYKYYIRQHALIYGEAILYAIPK